ncbi:MAG: hypothetical protein ABSH05_01340 [Bryobacteraceae bacterium]
MVPASDSPTAGIVERYVTAIQGQQLHPKAVSMEVDMDAQLPGLKKHGRFHALRFITKVGQIFYNRSRYEGDSTVKKEVIARYLEAEAQAREGYANSIAITPANYRFKFKGFADYGGRPAYVLQVTPFKKRVGLFKGELWIDQQTYLPLREWGELVKNPSVFLKNVYFVRDYYIYDGISIPRRLISEVRTRLVGRAQLTIWFDNYKLGEGGKSSVAALPSQSAPQPVPTDIAQH